MAWAGSTNLGEPWALYFLLLILKVSDHLFFYSIFFFIFLSFFFLLSFNSLCFAIIQHCYVLTRRDQILDSGPVLDQF